RVEVARNLGVGEHRARLVADLAAGVARREMREREQADLGIGRDLRGLARGAVAGLRRAVRVRVEARRLVGEDVRATGRDDDGVGRRGVARDDDLAPAPGLADDLVGTHAGDDLATLQAA